MKNVRTIASGIGIAVALGAAGLGIGVGTASAAPPSPVAHGDFAEWGGPGRGPWGHGGGPWYHHRRRPRTATAVTRTMAVTRPARRASPGRWGSCSSAHSRRRMIRGFR